jgi:hypothetical protein
MSISPLGIHVSVSDATLLGGVGLYFLTLWFFYSMRRENRLVGTLLRNARDADLPLMDLIYSGITSYMVFTAVRSDRSPIDSLAERSAAGGPTDALHGRTGGGKADAAKRHGMRYPGVQLLFVLPPLAIFGSVVFDIVSVYWLAAPFRASHFMPQLHGAELVRFWGYVMVGLLCLAVTGYNSYRVNALDRATGNVLREYGEMLDDKVVLATRLRASRDPIKRAHLDEDLYGISSDVIVTPDTALVELRFDRSRPQHWEQIVKHEREIRAAYPEELRLNTSTTAEPNLLEIVAAGKAPEDDQIRDAIRELYRIKRLVHVYIAEGPAQTGRRSVRGSSTWTPGGLLRARDP